MTSGRSRDTSATGAAGRVARTAPTWKAFTDAVASVLTVLEDGQFLILVRKRTNDFVQFAGVGRGRVRAEAVSNTLADANRSAGRATAAWLTGEGLASATETLRTRGGEETIPAPLLDQWRKMLLEAATQAVQAADDVLAHVNGEHRLGRERLAALADRGACGAAEAERSCRALARLALGVTSHMDWCEETARLERAAVLVLSGAGVRVEEDGVVFLGHERSELVTEAAGLLCWMLTQQRCGLVIGPPRTGRSALDVIVDGESNLLIRKDGEEQSWGAPVTVIEPARFIADFLSEDREVPLDA